MINREWLEKNKEKEHKLTATSHHSTSRSNNAGHPALLNLTYHNCGKRLCFGRSLFSALGCPECVEISTMGAYLVIKAAENENSGFHLSQVSKKKPILYNADVVKFLIDTFQLDLSVHSTLSFYEGQLLDNVYYILMGKLEEEPEETEQLEEQKEPEDEENSEEPEEWEIEEEEEGLDNLFCD